MPKYKLIINGKKVYKSKTKNLENFYNKIKNDIPNYIKYPHFWNLIYSPKALPNTIAEKIIYFSKPYRYYLYCKNNIESVDIETDHGYYFHGRTIVNYLKDLNYITGGSNSETSGESSKSEPDSDEIYQSQLTRDKESESKSDISSLDELYDSEFSDYTSELREKVIEKFITYYIKNFMSYTVFLNVLYYPNPDDNRLFDTISVI